MNWKSPLEILPKTKTHYVCWNQKRREIVHTHTNKIKRSTLIKNIDELIMLVMKEKSNFTGKNDDEEITHVLNLLPSQTKF